MTGAQAGILMLTGKLGDVAAEPLTPRQFQSLRRRMAECSRAFLGEDRDLQEQDLRHLGLPEDLAHRVFLLLNREKQFAEYLSCAAACDVFPLTRLHEEYPRILEEKLGGTAPAVLYCKGDLRLLKTPCISLVGSRRLDGESRAFAQRIGMLAAKEGFTLVSGGAVGADSEAQKACLQHGGRVIVFTPDRLTLCPLKQNVLYCSEDGFDEAFTSQRALSRNRLIHAMGVKTYVALCTEGKGGTWHGSMDNLRHGYGPLYVFDNGTPGNLALMQQGAIPTDFPLSVSIDEEQLTF